MNIKLTSPEEVVKHALTILNTDDPDNDLDFLSLHDLFDNATKQGIDLEQVEALLKQQKLHPDDYQLLDQVFHKVNGVNEGFFLIKEINDSLKPKDPVTEALRQADDLTALHDDQVDMLADYMKEMIDGAAKRGQTLNPLEAAFMALDDVAGFENAPQRVVRLTAERLVKAFNKKVGS